MANQVLTAEIHTISRLQNRLVFVIFIFPSLTITLSSPSPWATALEAKALKMGKTEGWKKPQSHSHCFEESCPGEPLNQKYSYYNLCEELQAVVLRQGDMRATFYKNQS